MGWLSIKIFKIIYFDTSFWSVWNLDKAESNGSSGSLSAQPLSMHFFTPQTTTVQLDLIRKSFQNCVFLNTVVERCSLTTFAEHTKLSEEVDTSEGRANLQEDQDRLEECANNFLSFSTGKNTEVQHQLVQEKQLNPALPCQEDEELARSEMWHMLIEFESPSGAAAQVAEGHGSKLLCAQTSALPSKFQGSPSWYRQGEQPTLYHLSFTSQRKAETTLC